MIIKLSNSFFKSYILVPKEINSYLIITILFNQAQEKKPCIIFFDEVDGLAPARSPKNDFVHTSVVSVLLAMMDGMKQNSGVIVIGATNRLDSIDPALRRPGRFDRELYFPLPNYSARKEIISVIQIKFYILILFTF